MNSSIGKRLEQYTQKRPQEVLLVTAEIEGEEDQIVIFKGFSSSLTRPTAFDAEIPVLPDTGKIINIDIALSPYNPDKPAYIQQGLTEEEILEILEKLGI
ncbi:DUF7734 family protein [Calothrix sp. 336/3]|uniref:DUF7734 family protein n=1 Tax=Calothrix sp. 336/3 TaxID=1337936 RepID=UPI0004E3F1D8|nr:hypothetical protein [Calothrix sp. 336/3]AKG23615.1 hypothetical protein IJ00_22080 [Calothrix sp. 336/3]